MSVPGRALGGVIEGLKEGLSKDSFGLLRDFHAGVVAFLKAGSGDAALQQRAALQEKLPQLQAAAVAQHGASEADRPV